MILLDVVLAGLLKCSSPLLRPLMLVERWVQANDREQR